MKTDLHNFTRDANKATPATAESNSSYSWKFSAIHYDNKGQCRDTGKLTQKASGWIVIITS
jgi:hypothetical protein